MILFFFLLSFSVWSFDCHYDYTVWNTNTRRSEGPYRISKWKKDLTQKEKGPFGCTPCREDQVKIKIKSLSFEVCKELVEKFKSALLESNFPITSILGYRPSVSRGPTDSRGLRTELSNHAFGVSLDINEEYNGLYNNCLHWNEQCVLSKGGPYRPFQNPRSITEDSSLVKAMEKYGFRWGGKIQGVQKDFMHFSPTGY